MNNGQLLRLLRERGIISNDGITTRGITNLKKHPLLWQKVIEQTCFLQYNANLRARIQCIIRGIIEQPTCATCGKIVKMRTTGQFRNTFPTYCSNKCIANR
jgi:hypothetical protein